jgi:hypothetical protein
MSILNFLFSFIEGMNGIPPPEKMEFGKEVKEDLNSNPEDDPTHFMAILVESLYMLRKIPEAAEVYVQPERAIKLVAGIMIGTIFIYRTMEFCIHSDVQQNSVMANFRGPKKKLHDNQKEEIC